MKSRTKKIWRIALVPLGGIFGFFAFSLFYGIHYAHQHCILQAGLAFRVYAGEHQGQLPFSTNGFGNDLLSLAKEDSSCIHILCGPDDDGHIFMDALKNHFSVSEDQC